jgi:hypothetical protein
VNSKNDLYLGIVLFLLNFMIAVSQNWSATDLVWSLWISSLVVGYAYILTTILGILIKGDEGALMGVSKNSSKVRTPTPVLNVFFLFTLLFMTGFSRYTLIFFLLVVLSILFWLEDDLKSKLGLAFLPGKKSFISKLFINFPGVLFLLAFFSFHFIFFHFVHSIFLNGFFPILDEAPFGKDIEETLFYFFDLIKISASRFWMFIALSAISRLSLYFRAFNSGGMASMFLPYKNVIRMHITIFAVAFLSMANVQNYALYLIFIIYFLPLGTLWRMLKPTKKTEEIPSWSSNKPID